MMTKYEIPTLPLLSIYMHAYKYTIYIQPAIRKTKTTNHAIFKATTETPPQKEQKPTLQRRQEKIANKLPICHPSNCSTLNEIENLIIKKNISGRFGNRFISP